ncbi:MULTISPECIES: TRAP transporter small permease [Bacillaceae]|uniref:TRAP-type C4-dicarboxylate transport system permease small subunit n=1 Tax=Peribacillus huizhouensis TaxID=1501239 RepID=A0ABR6CQU6_9BACI|nr:MULTISPECIES: TRAP transporter small permease [Bacillaceae]MBA9027412.1 TRAP-type C4-dicarboxylate transport system permease small subunit [Peribacillus huizhouensis]
MSLLKKFDRYFEESIIAVIFSGMVILTFAQVLSRFVFNISIGWTEEISRYFFVWLIYLSAAMAAKHGRHIRVEIIDTFFPRSISKWFGLLSDILWVAFTIFVAFYGYEMVMMMMGHGQLSPAVQLPMWLVYSIIPIGYALIALRVLQGIIGRFRGDDELSEEEKLKRAIEG